MNDEVQSILVIANIVELSKRVLSGVVGNDMSSIVGGLDVYDDAETLVIEKLRQRLIAKVN